MIASMKSASTVGPWFSSTTPAAAAKAPLSGNATGSYAQGAAAGDMPSSAKGQYVSAEERDKNMAANGGKLLYGMDKELAEKAAAKNAYEEELERERQAAEKATLANPGPGPDPGAVECTHYADTNTKLAPNMKTFTKMMNFA